MTDDIDIEWNGLEATQRNINRIADQFPGAVGAALFKEAKRIERTVINWTPKRTGNLQRSTTVDTPEVDESSGKVSVKLGQGTQYAAKVHSLSSLRSARNANARTQWWFKAFGKHSDGFKDRILEDAMDAVVLGQALARFV